ncbi:MAG: hypothetical protein N2171_03430 [Clostridia bacterium]|nr:hypothetical protein [Clostridia bacterium]
MKRKVWICPAVALFIFSVIYLMPNPVLRTIAPKRYIFLCMTNTVKELFLDEKFKPSSLEIGLLDGSFSAKTVNTEERQTFSCQSFFDGSKGFRKNSGVIQKYLSLKSIYRDCVNVKKSDKKDFSVIGDGGFLTAYGWHIDFKPDFKKKLMQRISEAVDDSLVIEGLQMVLDAVSNDAVITVYTDKKHRIMSLCADFDCNQQSVFAQITLKNQETLINDITFSCNIGKEITVNIRSSGNHSGENFTDETDVDVLSYFVKAAQLHSSINADSLGNSFNVCMSGKILGKTVGGDASGSVGEDGFDGIFTIRKENKEDIKLHINYKEYNGSYVRDEPFDKLETLTEKERDNVVDWFETFIKNSVIN